MGGTILRPVELTMPEEAISILLRMQTIGLWTDDMAAPHAPTCKVDTKRRQCIDVLGVDLLRILDALEGSAAILKDIENALCERCAAGEKPTQYSNGSWRHEESKHISDKQSTSWPCLAGPVHAAYNKTIRYDFVHSNVSQKRKYGRKSKKSEAPTLTPLTLAIVIGQKDDCLEALIAELAAVASTTLELESLHAARMRMDYLRSKNETPDA